MSNHEVFGQEFFHMSFKEAIKLGILVKYKIIAVGISDIELQESVHQRKYISGYETIDEIAHNYALDKFMKKYFVTHAVTFHSSVSKARSFQRRNRSLFPDMKSFHVNGGQSANDRDQIMNIFKHSPRAVVSNARCLTEGINVPAIDVVYFCDPKNSKIDIVQAVGRALRKDINKSKKFGYIFVPIFHKNEDQVEEIIESSSFKNLVSIIRALSCHDERLSEEIIRISSAKNSKSSRKIMDGDLIDFCNLILLEGFDDNLREALFCHTLNQSIDTWEENYFNLLHYSHEYGHCNITKQSCDNKQLGIWAENQRTKYKRGMLSEYRIQKLLEIGFKFDLRDYLWEQMYANLCEFKQKHGHCNIPQNFKENQLASWVTTQRQKFKLKKISRNQIHRLESIGFIFEPKKCIWDSNFSLLLLHKEKYGNCNVSANDIQNKKLIKWIDRQRNSYKNGGLTEEQIDKLHRAGIAFDPFVDAWHQGYEALLLFYEQHGHCNVKKNHINKYLATWVDKQRQKYKKNMLNNEQIEKLKMINFIFSPFDISFEEMFNQLFQYKLEHGNCNIPRKYSKNQSLANWTRKQRAIYNNGRLSIDRCIKLKEIGLI